MTTVRLPLVLPSGHDRGFDVVGLGLNCVDLLVRVAAFPEPDSKQPLERYEYQPGGQTASGLVACARQGWRARYVGRFGDDANGERGRRSLSDEGIDVGASRVLGETPTAFAVILVDGRTGTRTIMWHRDPRLNMGAADVQAEAVATGRVLLVDCHQTEASIAAARCARAAGMPVVLDVEKPRPNLEQLLRATDVIIAAQDLPGRLTGEPDVERALTLLARRFPAAVVCATLGSAGSIAVCQGVTIRTPGYEVPVVDTTGAGDVFRGGFISAWLQAGAGAVLEEVLRRANATAALSCRGLGARAGIPTRAEVDALVSA